VYKKRIRDGQNGNVREGVPMHSTRLTGGVLGVLAATLLAIQTTTAQGPSGNTGAAGPVPMIQVLHTGAAPPGDDGIPHRGFPPGRGATSAAS
jgi:hypothetical protein